MKNYRLKLTTNFKYLPTQVQELSLYTLLDQMENRSQKCFDWWMDNDNVDYIPWSGYPYKITKMKLNKNGDLVSLELTEL